MSSLRELIREEIERLFLEMQVDEADLSTHLERDRLIQRILDPGPRKIGFRIRPGKSPSSFHEVGTKAIPSSELAELNRKLEIIRKYKFSKFKSFAIKLANLFITPDTVNFYSEGDKLLSKGKTLLYLDYDTESYGNEIYIVIREDYGTTIMFSDNSGTLDNKFFGVDSVIKNFSAVEQKKVR